MSRQPNNTQARHERRKVPRPLQASASVRRNLGSALEQAEASEAGSRTGEATSAALAAEVQSRPVGIVDAAAAPDAAGAGTFARLRSGSALAVPATPAEAARGVALTPEAGSTGQQSSILSAAPDPAAPFSVPPSTTRRFAQRDAAGAGSRRWAWRRDGGAPAAAAGTAFQRARLASTSRPESPASPSDAAGSVEASAHSAGSSGRPSSGVEVPGAGGPAAEAASAQQSSTAAGAGAAAASQLQPTGAHPGSGAGLGTAFAAAAAGGAHRQRSGSGLGFAPLRTTISLAAGDSLTLPSPAERGGAPPTPLAPSSLLVEALLQELRAAAALEVRQCV